MYGAVVRPFVLALLLCLLCSVPQNVDPGNMDLQDFAARCTLAAEVAGFIAKDSLLRAWTSWDLGPGLTDDDVVMCDVPLLYLLLSYGVQREHYSYAAQREHPPRPTVVEHR